MIALDSWLDLVAQYPKLHLLDIESLHDAQRSGAQRGQRGQGRRHRGSIYDRLCITHVGYKDRHLLV